MRNRLVIDDVEAQGRTYGFDLLVDDDRLELRITRRDPITGAPEEVGTLHAPTESC